MKRIVNYIILIVVCLLPVMVSAKEKYEFNFALDDRAFLYEEDGIYYFTDPGVLYASDAKLYLYDTEGNFLREEIFYEDGVTSYEEFISSRRYKESIPYLVFWEDEEDHFYSEGMNEFISVYYAREEFEYYDVETDDYIVYEFSDDLEFTKNALGNERFEAYNSAKKFGKNIFKIEIFDNIYAVYYLDDNDYVNAYILDSEYNLIIEYISGRRVANIYEKNGIGYILHHNRELGAYRLDGTLIENISLQSEWLDDSNFGVCDSVDLNKLYVNDNKLIITFRYYNTCPSRMAWSDASDYVREDDGIPEVFTLVYDLNYKVDVIESSNGNLTYETKKDEDGKSYVELKITPKDGYSVEKIIVTDVNGNKIDVTNNKFYMPMSDVTVEVKYVLGEYLPIPDTLLNINMWSISFGIIIISVGAITMVKVISDNRIKE